jgi:maleate isomerase
MSRVALLTPRENPTVEAEMRQLLVCDYVVARLVSGAEDSRQRLTDYAERVTDTVGQFGAMPLSAIGFACTASSYLIGVDRERQIAERFETPFLFASSAIAAELERRRVGTIAVISPYPVEIHAAGLAYWRSRGLDVIHEERLEIGSTDTRHIYRLIGEEAVPLVRNALERAPGAVLLSGTGMPTLDLIAPDGEPPILSSNFCLARALNAAVGAANGD